MAAPSTTIMVPLKLKKALDALKAHHRESYAEVISKLVHPTKEGPRPLSKKARDALMAEGYKKMAKRDLALEREWAWASVEADRLLDER